MTGPPHALAQRGQGLLGTVVAITLLLWASAFVAIRHLGHDFSPGALSLGRLVIGSLCLAVFALPRRLPMPSRADTAAVAAIGVLWFGVYNVALNESEQRIDAGTAAMLIQVSPVLIAVLAAVFLGEQFTIHLAVGLALAFGGVAIIAFSTAPDRGDIVGVLLCLLAAAAYSISLILQKKLVARMSAIHVTWLACTVGAFACLPFAGQLSAEISRAPASSLWWLLYLGVFPTAIAFTTYAFALQHMPASRLGVTTFLVPPIAIVMGVGFLSETPPATAYFGGVLAFFGVILSRRTPVERGDPSARRTARSATTPAASTQRANLLAKSPHEDDHRTPSTPRSDRPCATGLH